MFQKSFSFFYPFLKPLQMSFKFRLSSPLSQRYTWRFYTPIARSAKIARCARCSDCDFRRLPQSAYKIADIWHVRYRRLNSPTFAKCARSRNFLRSFLRIASKTNPLGDGRKNSPVCRRLQGKTVITTRETQEIVI